MAKKNAYEPAALHRIYDKITGVCLGYIAPKLDEKGERAEGWHKITCDERGEWHCDCVGNAKFHQQCKHIKAAKELTAIRHEAGKPARWSPPVQEETPQVEVVESPVQQFANRFEQEAYEQEQRRIASLAELDKINQERHAWLDADKKRKAEAKKQARKQAVVVSVPAA